MNDNMATKKSSKRVVHDQNHYKAQAMLRDQWFQEKIGWLKSRFREVGCPLPKRPFKTYKEYMAWNDVFWQRYAEMEKTPEYLEAKLRITGNKEKMSSKEYYEIEDFREKFLPPVYGAIYREILEHYEIDPKDRGFHDFLERHIFFGRDYYPTSLFRISWIRNEKLKKMELFVQIEPHTKLADIQEYWSQIVEEQKRFPNFSGKNKAWEDFERDLEVYNLYKKLKGSGSKRNTSNSALDKEIFYEISKKYPKITITNIRTIVSRTRKRLGEI